MIVLFQWPTLIFRDFQKVCLGSGYVSLPNSSHGLDRSKDLCICSSVLGHCVPYGFIVLDGLQHGLQGFSSTISFTGVIETFGLERELSVSGLYGQDLINNGHTYWN